MRAIVSTLLLVAAGAFLPAAAPAIPPAIPPGAAAALARPMVDSGTARLLGLSDPERMIPNGRLRVSVREGDAWRVAGELPCDRFPRELTLDLGPAGGADGTGEVVVRIAREGGGAAHLDLAALGGRAPARVSVAGVTENAAPLARRDHDLLDIGAGDVELAFPAGSGGALALVARIESPVIGTEPFRFPPQNTFRGIGPGSSFYRYRLGATPVPGDGAPAALEAGTPLFREWTSPGSGHPPGPTAAWVGDDGATLRALVDFTSDNTLDGGKDYAALHVRAGDGVREFRVTSEDERWGRARFGTSAAAPGYRHKSYEFAIPLAELGAKPPAGGAEIALAFSAYGTSTPIGNHNPVIAFDTRAQRYLVVYTKYDGASSDLFARLLDPDAAPLGAEVRLSSTPYFENSQSVAYAPELGRYLVVWADVRPAALGPSDVYGRFVGPDGSPIGRSFRIARATGQQSGTQVAYDPVHRVFLATWMSSPGGFVTADDLRGRIVAGDGPRGEVVTIAREAAYENWQRVVADTTRGRFLVLWETYHADPGGFNIHGRFVSAAGRRMGPAVAIPEGGSDRRYPSGAYDPHTRRFLVAWKDGRNASSDVYGRILADSGLPVTGDFPVSDEAHDQLGPTTFFLDLSLAGLFIVAWPDERTPANNRDVYYQIITTDGLPFSSLTSANLPAALLPGQQWRVTAAYNADCLSFLLAFDSEQFAPTDVGLAMFPTTCPVDIGVRTPSFGQVFPPGWKTHVQWQSPPEAQSFRIRWSPDGGLHWRRIARRAVGRDRLWRIPRPRGNLTNCLLQIDGYRDDGSFFGSATGLPFAIEVLRLDTPQNGVVLGSGTQAAIWWTTNRTAAPVARSILSYSLDDGLTWTRIGRRRGNPGFSEWTVPATAAPVPTARVRIDLRDVNGRRLGVDESDAPFTITP